MNGWINRETWLASLWGFGDIDGEDSYIQAVLDNENLDDTDKIDAIAEYMKTGLDNYIDERFPSLTHEAGIISDLMGYSFQNINWYEIAEAWYKDNG